MTEAIEFGSVCSGIEAASVAWGPLGWRAAWLAEIEQFPCAVLAHHYPDVPNLGDMTTIARRVLTGEVKAPDVLTGGTPCQAFSVAGLRESLADQRGNLTLKFVELADAIDHVRRRAGKPACVVKWENVPGVLSTKDNAFGCFLAGLAGEDDALEPPGGRWADSGCVLGPARAIAWRTLDAQYFGLAQRRRRVIVVASARAGFDPAQVLFEWQGLRRDSAPRRQAGQGAAGTLAASTGGSDENDARDGRLVAFGGGNTGGELDVSTCLTHHGSRLDFDSETFVTTAFAATEYESGAFDQVEQAAPLTTSADRTRAAPIVAFSAKDHGCDATEDLAPTLRAGGHANSHANAGVMPAVCVPEDVAHTLRANYRNNSDPAAEARMHVQQGMQVRRLTPCECERLQGFPDDYTLIPYRGKPAEECPDGPRYKALGNSWAVTQARWVGRRIQQEMNR